VITLDGYAASHRAVAQLKEVGTLPRRVRIRSSQYLNNIVEQDHRRIKQRIRPMLGFKRFETAAVAIRGIELAEKISCRRAGTAPMLRKALAEGTSSRLNRSKDSSNKRSPPEFRVF